MLNLLDVDDFVSRNKLEPVTSIISTTRDGSFHEDGLFSERLFGPIGSDDRRKLFSYIDLYAKVVNPSALRIILQLERKIEKFLSTEESFSLDSDGRLVEDPKGVTGIKSFIELFPKIKFRGETDTRDKLIKFIERSNKEKNLFVEKLPIIPPDLRPAVKGEDGQWMIDALNDVYLAIMRRASQVRSSGSGPLYDLLNYALQKSVSEHDDFIRSKISKKRGIIRQQMLGKRIDFSGRAIISPGPDINVNEVGVPFRMAVGLFEPFIIHRLQYSGRVSKDLLEKEIKEYSGLELTVDSIKKVLKSIKEGDELPESLYELFFEQTEVSMKDRVVVLKRDPVLHPQGYHAYYPVLHRGDTILMSCVQVGGHSADFDGDAVAIYHPMTNEAQAEAKEKMMRLTSGTSSSQLSFEMSKEMWVGLYIITKNKSGTIPAKLITDADIDTIKNPYTPVKYRGELTTAGKAIFNYCLPPRYPYQKDIATRAVVGKILQTLSEKATPELFKATINKLRNQSFKWATITAPNMSLDQFELPKEIYQIKEKLKTSTPEQAQVLLEGAQKIVQKELKDTGFGDLVEAGSTKGWGQPMQILVAKGIIADPDGNVLDPIAGSFADGLSNEDFFKASQGARKGIIDRVINTADTGYMARKLAYLLNTVELSRDLKDCKTTGTLDLKLTADLAKRLTGRYVLKGGTLMSFKEAKIKIGEIIHLRSPIYCKSPKMCHACYGKLLERHKSPYVGILASMIIGERGTQLIMKTFHTGGAVSLIKRDMLSDIINNDPMAGLSK